MVDAIPCLASEKAVELFEKFGVFTRAELESRTEVRYESYAKEINIEARAMINIAGKQLIPAIIRAATGLGESIAKVKPFGIDTSVQEGLLTTISESLVEAQKARVYLDEVATNGLMMESGREQAVYYRDVVCQAMEALRVPIDRVETIVDKDIWPMPSYGDLLFEV